jgi:hypothetical protein
MNRVAKASLCLAFALLTFFQFPGHTWLQQDTQIYVPILEHLRDASVLRNDILVAQPHVAYTIYDETALTLRAVTGLGFREVLAAQQILTRALGFWGLLLLAEALGLAFSGALTAAAILSLGAIVAGPAVLTIEYDPTPRAFAFPLVLLAIGLAARGRYVGAGIAAAVATLYHPPTAIPFWIIWALLCLWPEKDRPQRLMAFVPLGAATLVLRIAAQSQREVQTFGTRLTASMEMLQRLRASYVYVSTWPWPVIGHHLILFAILLTAFVRLRHSLSRELRAFLVLLPALGLLSMPISWLLLEQGRFGIVPQLQPMRTLLFVTVAMQLLCAVAGIRAKHSAEAALWFTLAFLLPLQPSLTGPYVWNRIALAAALGIAAAFAGRFRWAVAVAAFFAIPWIGGVVNYPAQHTPELAQLSSWARANTPPDAVFLFADTPRGLDAGVFRSDALRAIYVDWKGGGQVNYLTGFGEQWWFRWQQTLARKFTPADLPRYEALGIDYAVLRREHATTAPPTYENGRYVVYRLCGVVRTNCR